VISVRCRSLQWSDIKDSTRVALEERTLLELHCMSTSFGAMSVIQRTLLIPLPVSVVIRFHSDQTRTTQVLENVGYLGWILAVLRKAQDFG
jgi:hypothetical protein